MSRRVLIDVLIAAVLAAASQLFLYAAYLVLLALGVSMPYDSAPAEPGSHPEWLAQINAMFLLASGPVLLAALALAWILDANRVGSGMWRVLVWPVVVMLSMLAIALGNGTLALFGVVGVWVYVATFAVAPALVGRWRRPPHAAPG
jgi:hypothetical protein